MTRRLANMCLLTLILIGISSPPLPAHDDKYADATLKGISSVWVLVEYLPDGAKVLGLTAESIQTDVALKLRLAGMRVVKEEEWPKLPGSPELYVRVTLSKSGVLSFVSLGLRQSVLLERNGQLVLSATTWDTGALGSNQDAQDIRTTIKDKVDEFLNAWLSVNPKK